MLFTFLQVPNSLSVTAHGVEVQYGSIHSALDQIRSYSVTVSSPSNNESELDFSFDETEYDYLISVRVPVIVYTN